MLNIEEINEEIERLENCECTTYSICEKLAILYTVREHYEKSNMKNIGVNKIIAPAQSTGMTAM